MKTKKEEEIKIVEAISKQKRHKGSLENEVEQYLKNFVDKTVKDIKTYEQFDAVKKLLAPVQPTLAAMINNSGVLPKEVKNVYPNKKIIPQRRLFSVKKKRNKQNHHAPLSKPTASECTNIAVKILQLDD